MNKHLPPDLLPPSCSSLTLSVSRGDGFSDLWAFYQQGQQKQHFDVNVQVMLLPVEYNNHKESEKKEKNVATFSKSKYEIKFGNSPFISPDFDPTIKWSIIKKQSFVAFL